MQGRVDSIPSLFAAAADDIQAGSVTADVVRAVWARVMPGLLEHYDAPFSLPCIAPRPLLIANGEVDPRCPLHGLKEPMQLAQDAYLAAGLSKEETDQRLVLHVEPGLGHATNPSMFATVRAWFDKFLLVPATAT